MNRSEKQLLPICAILLLAAGCVTRTASHTTVPETAAQGAIKPASLSEYIRGVYKLSAEASRQLEQREALLAAAPELADLVDRAEKDPTDNEARSTVIGEYMSRKLYWGAYELLTETLPVTGAEDPDTNLNLAIIWDAWGLYDLAVQYGERAVAHGAASAKAFETMGRIQLHRGDPAQALVWYKRALELDRTAPVLANMGYAHMLRAEWETARTTLEEATTLDDNLEEAHNNLAVVLSKAGDNTGALAHLLRTGTRAVAFNNMGVLYLQQNKLRDAQQYFQEALRLDPNYERARRNLTELETLLQPPSAVGLPASASESVKQPPTGEVQFDGNALFPAGREATGNTDDTLS
jgi:tetratricopeptide (TPR) repeat protein